MRSKARWFYAVWLVLIGGFAVLHALNLRADFPNHSPWWMDWAKYTDEGWYGNAAIRAHLFGSWYLAGDFNPAPAVPVWPFLEWILFHFTGVSAEAARGLAVAFFFANLVLSYLLLRRRVPKWTALLAITLMVTSPFLYSFSRLAILEPMLTALTLAALNLAVRLPAFRRRLLASACIGVLFTLMMLTKTTAVFLLPALGWALVRPLWSQRKVLVRCVAAACGSFLVFFGAWMGVVMRAGLMPDYRYLFFVNKYPRPSELYWPLVSFWWSLNGGLWVDLLLFPLAGLLVVGTALAWASARARALLLDPVFGASVLAIGGYILFMTYQDHPQPRYYAVVAFFAFLVVAQGLAMLWGAGNELRGGASGGFSSPARLAGLLAVVLTVAATCINAVWTLNYATHPEYTFADAAVRMTRYIDMHPNGRRMLVSVSSDEISLFSHVPSINDLFIAPNPQMVDLATKLQFYRPGWYACWNQMDAGALEDLHSLYSVEQVATFRAFDDPRRNVLVLFKLHPWPDGRVHDPADENLRIRFPEDRFEVPLE